jgi:hypothetical protein
MTVGISDLAELRCSADMISAGITFACRAHLPIFTSRTHVSMSHLRRLIAHSISSLAIRRWLMSEKVPHNLSPCAPLTNPDLHEITIGGQPLHSVSLLITNRDLVRSLRHEPQSLLRMEIPTAGVRRQCGYRSQGGLLAVCVLLADVCHSRADSLRRLHANEPVSAIAISPRPIWRQQRPWQPLGRLAIINLGNDPLEFDLCGLDVDRRVVIDHMVVPARQSTRIGSDLYNILFIATGRIPTMKLRIDIPSRNANWLITPSAWSNLWLYETFLVLAGWLTREDIDHASKSHSLDVELRKHSRKARGSSRIRIHELRPIEELLQRIRHM